MEYGYIKEGKVIRNSFLDFPERVIGEVKDSAEQATEFFNDRFKNLEKEVADLEEKVSTNSNKGSFLTKVVNLKENLAEIDALGDFENIHHRLAKMEEDLNEYIQQNRHKNLQIKTALIEELKGYADSHEWKSATAAVKEIQQKWIKTGAVEEEHREKIENEYEELTNGFFERRASFYAELDKMMEEKEEDFKDFIKAAKKKLKGLGLDELKNTQKQLMEEWKALGTIKKERHSTYWEEFQSLMNEAFQSAKKKAKTSKSSLADNEKAKKALLNELKKINENLLPEVNLSTFRHKWKSIGFAGKDVNDQLNAEFNFQTMLISEKQFLDKLLKKRAKKGASEADKNKLRQKLIRELISRDVAELKTFEENVDKFRTAKGLDDLLENKLNQQKIKVEVKKELLKQAKAAGAQ